ncbi:MULTISPECIES: 4-hydroxythreonine-4-phosphate dehydrogenase PdxA [unclassified Pseudovibrio]|uniref:4-hydroxythreonine-4-phosphate dehydrogenase PdxA n=1 Tax=unclassified Pseudovibrio TaxID=2627060 RepID=UPI0007093E90|nr:MULTISPECIES: 4-hydroxythreonine-4-phosphate dehydrogenase PdxA [unclassified Pseudovibrio]KZK97616.1 4-hydroxythreonine-4-phosphate dehydrogenase 1 [Pseudovibrio sp. Ad5]KZL02567.1 4-hydroxythreonine-4-phosphate dehydrogenase 1 [Pseudovibrio sp. W74]KZL07890.1 4-hydroxythreonine-4-phosphate dehydrogenase 1 [Pseudovibrio sp. Ad14]KZL27459.1 4-hydroxythreonine-4-phosphate dehydrogenase 1 [Pseudovibrio sp. WM33]
MRRVKLALALTMGEPAGIGPDITLKTWKVRFEQAVQPFYVLCDPELLKARAKHLGLKIPIKVVEPEAACDCFDEALPVVPLSGPVQVSPGAPSGTNAALVIESIETAVRHVKDGRASAVVTNPISKKILYDAGFHHPGHTEFLGDLAKTYWDKDVEPIMLLAGPELMAVPLTVHVPIVDVPKLVTKDLIVDRCRAINKDMIERFGIASPRIAIAGLNPHAGEGGSMGTEEIETISPAIAQLRSEGIDARGPLPADTMFHSEALDTYDVAVAMYHDQALIPVKTLAFDEAVNVTLGLPYVRTSPDHGTAFSIAGTNKASPNSLMASLRLAAALAQPELV